SFTHLLAVDESHHLAQIEGLSDRQVHSNEWRFRRKDGSVFVGELSRHQLPDGRIQGVIRDISERKLAQDKLRASEKFSRTVLENSPDCVKVLDCDGRLQFMNTNGLCLMEIDDFAQVRHRCWWDLWVEDARALVQDAVNKARHGETVQFQAL